MQIIWKDEMIVCFVLDLLVLFFNKNYIHPFRSLVLG